MLALQLDNWNDARKEQALFQEYLVQLQDDLKSDVNAAKRTIEQSKVLDERADYLTAVIADTAPKPIDQNLLIVSILTSGYAYLNLVNRTTYDDLISTGNLRLFTDIELKRAVSSYYAFQERGTQWNSLIRSVQIDYRRETRRLLSADQFRWARMNSREIESDAPPMDMEAFASKTRGDVELLGVISAMAEIQVRTRNDAEDTREYATALLEKLENYRLDTRSN